MCSTSTTLWRCSRENKDLYRIYPSRYEVYVSQKFVNRLEKTRLDFPLKNCTLQIMDRDHLIIVEGDKNLFYFSGRNSEVVKEIISVEAAGSLSVFAKRNDEALFLTSADKIKVRYLADDKAFCAILYLNGDVEIIDLDEEIVRQYI